MFDTVNVMFQVPVVQKDVTISVATGQSRSHVEVGVKMYVTPLQVFFFFCC